MSGLERNAEQSTPARIRLFIFDNIVTIIFVVFLIVGYIASPGITASGLIGEVVTRFFRNGLLVLSLIIPVMAGLGLNFGIVIGAMAAVLALIFVRYHNGAGLGGLLIACLIALPLALLFGYLTGKLFNKTRGQEMIASLIVGYFAEGLFLIFVLFIIGGLIPVQEGHIMIIPSLEEKPIGVRATFDLGMHPSLMTHRMTEPPGLKYALDYIWRIEFHHAFLLLSTGALGTLIFTRIRASKKAIAQKTSKFAFGLRCGLWSLFVLLGLHAAFLPHGLIVRFSGYGITLPASPLAEVGLIPAVTGLVILLFCLLIHFFTKTKLGQDCRSVGQSQHISQISGINVDRVRIIATMISTVLAAWGMIIFLQEVGTVSTYTHHRMVGMFSVAALLVGGATAAKAGVKNALFGLLLFHSMFVVSPGIGRLISANEQVGEYTRSFMVYGVIGLSLGLYVWKTIKAARDKESLDL